MGEAWRRLRLSFKCLVAGYLNSFSFIDEAVDFESRVEYNLSG